MITHLLADDCGVVDLSCKADNWFEQLVKQFAQAAAKLLGSAMTWWTQADHSSMLRSPAIGTTHALLFYVSVSLLVGGVMWQGVQMMIKRRPEPLVNTGLGLFSYLVWSTVGSTLAVAINEAGIALASQVLNASIDKFASGMQGALFTLVVSTPGLVLLLSLVLFVLALIQWILGFFRMGALVILLALLPTAAAGQLNEATKPWLRKVLSWCLSLLLYQPLSAVVFSIGFLLLGQGDGVSQVLVGLTILALAVISMPAMLRFFDWGGQQLVSSSAGSGGGAMAVGAAANMMGGGNLSQFMSRSGPASGGSDGGGAPSSVSPANDGPGDNHSEGGAGDTPVSGSPGTAGGGKNNSQTGGHQPQSESAGSGGLPSGAAESAPTKPLPAPGAGAGGQPSGATDAGAGASGGAGAGGGAAAGGAAGAAVVAGQVAREQADRAQGAVSNAMTGDSGSGGPDGASST